MGGNLTPVGRDWMIHDVQSRFGLTNVANPSRLTLGAELELLPLYADTLLPVPIRSHTTSCSLDILRKVAVRLGWVEIAAGTDPPSWELASGARVSFEPGGQLEISSAPKPTASGLIAELSELCAVLTDAFDRHGLALNTMGVDPHNSIDKAPLQLHRDRYESMTRYFDSIGTSGIRMMRQTASVQINIQCGADPLVRWSLLNRLAPIFVAMFANSAQYDGADTGHVSYRAHLWRTLDTSRTGIFFGDAIDEYCDFALGAGWMFSHAPSGEVQTFRQALEQGATEADWNLHLSTLFPEIRPKGFFEIRSPDMIDCHWLPASIGIVAGICYDAETSKMAAELVGGCSDSLLARAGEAGVRDPEIASLARSLGELAIAGCESLGPAYINNEDLDTVRDFVDRYPANGRCPADDS